ncbi:MAG TPA: response regulator transcription factor [Bacteroidota bacterium]|jgi:DNA-binding NarL/FixJ family response regulator|nr:response regulator transcription factor [Bacteroidota bacterium]
MPYHLEAIVEPSEKFKESKLRILLADDHALVRAGFKLLLEDISGIQVIGEASNGREALAMIRTHYPDIVLMDIAMMELNGLEALERAKKEFPDVHIIILSMHANEEYVIQALRAGASGYLLKGADISEFELAIRSVARGEKYLSPPVSKQVVNHYMERIGVEEGVAQELTPRQREILQLIAEGHSVKEIAHMLELSAKTVETHRAQLMERLNIRDIPGLVRYAIRKGIVASHV